MESEYYYSETSQDFSKYFRNLRKNDSSNVSLTFGTDTTGIIDISEKETEGNVVEKYPYRKEKIIHDSLKLQEEMDFYKRRVSSSIRPTIYFSKERMVLNSPQINIIPLKFSNEVEKLIIRDSTFRKFISEIERSLNEFINLENVRLDIRIFFEEDWEIPDYKKLVLSLNFKGIPFKQEMTFWKKINTITYERIKSIIPYSSEEQVKKIKELKKNFFIKLEM